MLNELQTEPAVRRHQLLMNSFLELLRHKPYNQISVADICRKSSIPRRTFYHYFENKDALMDAIIKDLMLACNLASMFDFSSGTEALKQSLLRFFRFWYGKNQEILGLLLQNGLESRLTKFALKLAQEEHIGRSCPTQQKFPSEKIKSILLASSFFAILAYWISNNCQESPEEMAEYVTNYLSNPIYPSQK
ncbi:MAG: TetR/AcrR family transcriptional regulator [Oscillospiraceae bacterium]|nr:TetR/AcrR family transcriptional regulator [Oscillospiraceae bacterium]